MTRLAVLTDDLSGPLQLASNALVRDHDLIECIGDLTHKPYLVARQAHGKVSVTHGLQSPKQLADVELPGVRSTESFVYLKLKKQTYMWGTR